MDAHETEGEARQDEKAYVCGKEFSSTCNSGKIGSLVCLDADIDWQSSIGDGWRQGSCIQNILVSFIVNWCLTSLVQSNMLGVQLSSG